MSNASPTAFQIVSLDMVEGIGGHWINDQHAVQTGAEPDGFFFRGQPSKPQFSAIRAPSVAFCIALRLHGGQRAYGDCVTVANLGYGGRPDPLQTQALPGLHLRLAERFSGVSFAGFRAACAALHDWPEDLGGRPVAYGLSQAFLNAAAQASGRTLTEVLRLEYGIERTFERPGFAASCGHDWHKNADKAIARRVAMFPQSAIQTADECRRLPEYVSWIVDRIGTMAPSSYTPDLHFDFHASLGRMFDNDEERVFDYLADLVRRARHYRVYFEDPLLAGSATEACERALRLRQRMQVSGLECGLIADEWANAPGEMALFVQAQAAHAIQIKVPDNGALTTTIDAVRMCQSGNVLAYLGGSCNETDISVRTTAHVGLAFGVWRLFTKPGLGFDEGLMVMTNELNRAAAGM